MRSPKTTITWKKTDSIQYSMFVNNQKWKTKGTSTMQDSSKSNTCQQRGRKKTTRNMLVQNKKLQPHGSSTMQDSSEINKADPVSGLALALNLTRAR